MELNSIINNDTLSGKLSDIYKFINKNEDKFNDIFNRLYNDIKNLYPNTTMVNNTIEVCDDNDNMDSNSSSIKDDAIYSMLHYHAKEVLGDKSDLVLYNFEINKFMNRITIEKKH